MFRTTFFYTFIIISISNSSGMMSLLLLHFIYNARCVLLLLCYIGRDLSRDSFFLWYSTKLSCINFLMMTILRWWNLFLRNRSSDYWGRLLDLGLSFIRTIVRIRIV